MFGVLIMIAQLMIVIKLDHQQELWLNWNSPIGPMIFYFSQNISKADTDETQSFSFNLGTTF